MQPWLRSAGLELNVLKIRHTMKGPAFALGGAGLVPDWMHPAYDDGCNELWQGTHQPERPGTSEIRFGVPGDRASSATAGETMRCWPRIFLVSETVAALQGTQYRLSKCLKEFERWCNCCVST